MKLLVAAIAVAGLVCATAAGETIHSGLDPGWRDSQPQWSPAAPQILFARAYTPPKDTNQHRLALVSADGSEVTLFSQPTGDPEVWDVAASFSPDGRQVLVTRELNLVSHAVYVKDFASGRERRLTSPGGDERGGNWSPDGSRVAFARSDRKTGLQTPYTERADGSDARPLGRATRVAEPRYLPDGKSIAIDRYDGRSWVAVVPAEGGPERALTPRAEWRSAGASPDGTTVLLVQRGAEANPVLWLARVDGKGRRVVARGADDGSFSPDGTRVLFTSGLFTRDHGIYLVGIDGRGKRRVVPRGRNAAWSPNGRTIAYSDAGPCNDEGIYVVPAAGGQARRLTQDCRIRGTPGSDVLLGSRERDVIAGHGGDDVIRANPGDLPNVYHGEEDFDLVDGGSGNDEISGGRGADVLRGGAGDDRIFGGRGADRLDGGPGRDLLDGGSGKDVISVRDGERDIVRCGDGIDRVTADAIDSVAPDCERVRRF